MLKTNNLFTSKGKGKATYYVAGVGLSTEPILLSTEPSPLNTEVDDLSTEVDPPCTEAGETLSTEANAIDRVALLKELPEELEIRILDLKERESNPLKVKEVIKEICSLKPRKLVEIASILQKGDNYISRKYLKPMIDSGELRFQFPEMINHPDQAYLTPNKL
jgi:ATP-dependent DNA helicase RecG